MAIIMLFFVAIGFCGGLVETSFALFPVPDELRTQARFLFTRWQSVDKGLWFLAFFMQSLLCFIEFERLQC